MRLYYTKPADQWVEAIPVGNGRLGAMVFGGVERERLQLNEATLWSGGPSEWNNAKGPQVLPQVREAVFAGRYADAERLCKQMQGPFNQSYLPMGDLHLSFAHDGAAERYERTLDLASAVATTQYRVGTTTFRREVFASFPDQVIVVRLSADGPAGLDFHAELSSLLRFEHAPSKPNELVLLGRAPSHVDPSYYRTDNPVRYDENGEGMRFDLRQRVRVEGGVVETEGNGLRVKGAKTAELIVSAATSYRSFDRSPGRDGVDPTALAAGWLEAAGATSFDTLHGRHVQDVGALFGRVQLELGTTAEVEQLTTEQRLIRYARGGADPGLEALVYQFGRYLLIASSRPGGQPANLQGIWNHEIRPAWSSNWTININTQMNYWLAEPTALSELHLPLLEMVRDLSVNGAKTARVNYGMRGWVSHHNADLWRQSAPVGDWGHGDPVWANYAMSAPWLCQHLWEHYAFTGDREFLRDHAWPVMKGAAEFCLDWLVADTDGSLVTAPSTSPELAFTAPDGSRAMVTKAATMDLQIIHDHFTNCIHACNELGVDAEFARRLSEALGKLLPMRIGSRGNIQEWADDHIEQEVHHRHVSHLFGLHPGRQITPRTPKLFEAARRTLEIRGDDGTGWSLAWKINFWARLRDGDHAYRMVRMLIRSVGSSETSFGFSGGLYLNLFDAHPPFQIDGNFGFTAGVTELLLQSHQHTEFGYEIDLLPALPGAWSSGSVTGLRARGGFAVDMTWTGGRLTTATLRAGSQGGRCVVRYGEQAVVVRLDPGGTWAWPGGAVS